MNLHTERLLWSSARYKMDPEWELTISIEQDEWAIAHDAATSYPLPSPIIWS